MTLCPPLITGKCMSGDEIKTEVAVQLQVQLASLTEKITALDRLMLEKFAGEQKARDLLSEQNLRHFADLNHAKAEAKEVQRTFVEKTFYQSEHKELSNKIETLSLWKENQIGKHSTSNYIAIGALVLALAGFVVGLLK